MEDVVRAFLRPALEMRSSPEGRVFFRLQARVHIEPDDLAYSLRRQVYDESTKAYVEEFDRMLPHLGTRTIYWRIVQFIGTYLYLMSDAHRLGELSGDLCDPDDDEQFLAQAVAFALGGLTAPPVSANIRRAPSERPLLAKGKTPGTRGQAGWRRQRMRSASSGTGGWPATPIRSPR